MQIAIIAPRLDDAYGKTWGERIPKEGKMGSASSGDSLSLQAEKGQPWLFPAPDSLQTSLNAVRIANMSRENAEDS